MKLRNSLLIILGLLAFAPSADAVVEIPSSTVKSLYHMEDTADSSGNGYNRTDKAGGAYATGKLSNAYYTAGVGTSSANTAAWDTSGDYTIGFWFKATSTWDAGNSGHAMFGKRTSPASGNGETAFGHGQQCTSAGNQEWVHGNAGASCPINYAQSYTGGTWYWLVVTRDVSDGYIDFYVDNVLKATAANTTSTNPGGPFELGYFGSAYSSANFAIDELFFTNTRLSTSTRDSLYNSGNGAEICVTDGCSGTPWISSTPASFSFTSTNTSGTLTITNTGLGTLAWAITSTQPWLTFSTNSGSFLANVSGTTKFITNLWGYASGTYNATATITDATATNSPKTVPVQAVVPDPAGGGGSEGTRAFWFMSLLKEMRNLTLLKHQLT